MMGSVPERQPELAGEDWRATGLLRVESRLMRTRAVGVRGGLLTLVPFRNTTLLYHAKWQSQTPRELFFRFFSGGAAGRPLADGLWPLWVGGKEKPPTSADFRRDADSGGRTAPRLQAVDYSAVCPQASCAVEVWRTYNIHHVIMMSIGSERKSRRIHGAQRTGLPASGRPIWNVPDGLSWPPCGLAESFTS